MIRGISVAYKDRNKLGDCAGTEQVSDHQYNKTWRRTNKLDVHDATNDLNVGDRVRVQETRPLSKMKRWRVLDVVERAR